MSFINQPTWPRYGVGGHLRLKGPSKGRGAHRVEPTVGVRQGGQQQGPCSRGVMAPLVRLVGREGCPIARSLAKTLRRTLAA